MWTNCNILPLASSNHSVYPIITLVCLNTRLMLFILALGMICKNQHLVLKIGLLKLTGMFGF